MKVAAGASWVMVDKLVKALGGLLVGVLVTRYLGPAELGLLNYGILILTMCTGFVPGALKYHALKDMAVQRQEGFSESLAQIMGVTLLGYAVGLCMAWLFAPDGAGWITWVVLSSALWYPVHALKYLLEHEGDFKRVVIIENTAFVLASVAKLLVIYTDGGALGMGLTLLLEASVSAVLLLRVDKLRTSLPLLQVAARKLLHADTYRGFKGTSALWLTALVSVLYARVDQFIIAHYLMPKDLGLYSAAMKINEMSMMFPTILMTVFYPLLSRQHAQPAHGHFTEVFRGMMALMLYGAILYTGVVYCLADNIVVWLFGQSYQLSAMPLTLISLATVTTFVGYLWHAQMVLQGQGRRLLQGSVVCVVLSWLGSSWAVPRYGINGAAAATACAFIVAAVYGFMLHQPRAFFQHVVVALCHPWSSVKQMVRVVNGG